MKLHPALESARAAITEALLLPVLAEFPEGATYYEAPQCRALGNAILGVVHRHLVNARIEWLFRKAIKRQGEVIGAKMGTAGARLNFLQGADFVCEVNWEQWRGLSSEARVALIDHELCHCGVDQETSKYLLIPHDVEEFRAIVQRHGLWNTGLQALEGAMRQLDLFEAAAE